MSLCVLRTRRQTSHDRQGVTKAEAARRLVEDCGSAAPDPVIDRHPALPLLGGREAALDLLHRRWVTHFGVALDEELESGQDDVTGAAWQAWRRTTIEQPSLARILSWYRDDPVVRSAEQRHRALLGEAAACDAAHLPGFCYSVTTR